MSKIPTYFIVDMYFLDIKLNFNSINGSIIKLGPGFRVVQLLASKARISVLSILAEDGEDSASEKLYLHFYFYIYLYFRLWIKSEKNYIL